VKRNITVAQFLSSVDTREPSWPVLVALAVLGVLFLAVGAGWTP
jgi:hypothetical protein